MFVMWREVMPMFMFNIWVLRAIIAVVLISVISATVGSFSIFQKSTFFVSGIAHGSLAGAALGIYLSLYFFKFNPFLMAIIFSIIFALLIGYTSRKKEEVDVAIGIMFSFSMSLAILFLSMIKEYASVAWGLIIGDLLLLSQEDIQLMLLSVSLILLLFLIFRRKILFSIFDPESAESLGLNPYIYQSLLFVLIAIGVVVLLKGVGAILVYALLIVPSAAAKRFTQTLEGTIILSLFISLLSGIGGIAFSLLSNVAPSAYAGLISTFIYFLSLFKK